ncbi:hypothetical protein [Caenispirillum bisanense]|uniref:hypothetical protein n=1 Tax=Caenispirillum bisanense TaxID=414052 RepID=UPI0031DED774
MVRQAVVAACALAAMVLLMPRPAMADDGSPAIDSSRLLGGLPLDAAPPGALPLSAVSPPPVIFSLEAPQDGRLPVSGPTTAFPTLPGSADDHGRTLGTRLSLGQPLGLDLLGGSLDWRATASIEQGLDGEAYGIGLSIGSLSDGGLMPPSDLRMGLTYGTAPDAGEHGVMLDFSYRF